MCGDEDNWVGIRKLLISAFTNPQSVGRPCPHCQGNQQIHSDGKTCGCEGCTAKQRRIDDAREKADG